MCSERTGWCRVSALRQGAASAYGVVRATDADTHVAHTALGDFRGRGRAREHVVESGRAHGISGRGRGLTTPQPAMNTREANDGQQEPI
jgi:hypothetical protein